MGNTAVRFEAGAEALDGTGEKVCLSSIIENVTPEQFMGGFEDWLLTRKPMESKFEKDIKAWKDEDGAIVTEVTVGPSGAAALVARQFELTLYYRWILDRDSFSVQTLYYGSNRHMRRSVCSQISHWRISPDPFRIEFWVQELEVRIAGPLLRDATVRHFAQDLGIECTAETEQPSVLTEGHLSIISAPLSDQSLNPEKLFMRMREFLLGREDSTEVSDGSIIQEVMDPTGLFIMQYQNVGLTKDKRFVYMKKFGDVEMQELQGISFVGLLSDPVRFELWFENQEYRKAGQQEAGMVTGVVQGVLEHLAQSSSEG